ncbi:MAG: SusC/RagA family TonB-linked outer membrane protein [Chitinophagaceae bacterium]|nr:MAG: SusC/RagA family TonB-linked outer membrane protein [Chitinophagaceae bacterium]
MYRKLILWALLLAAVPALGQSLRGRVIALPDSIPLEGATIRVKGSSRIVVAGTDGRFELTAGNSDTLQVSATGFLPSLVSGPFGGFLTVALQPFRTELEAVVVSTGYQQIDRERATGSFVKVDNELLNRSVGANVIDRINHTVPGLVFNKVGTSELSIRGQGTIFGNAEPLVVIDNFPFEGNLSDINPNDVESITVLKDAAAASIWGARAGNGVIVVTSKRGIAGRAVRVGVQANVTLAERPDLYARPQLSSADYIGIEERLFAEGYYQSALSSGYQPLTPAVELLLRRQSNPVDAAGIDQEIARLKNIDVRKQFGKYLYRKPFEQQYSLSIDGGGANNAYYISAGHDRNLEGQVGNDYGRTTISTTHNFKFLKGRLELVAGLNYSLNASSRNSIVATLASNATAGSSLYPYAELAGADGTPLEVVKNFRQSFVQEAGRKGLLDWRFVPLEEMGRTDAGVSRENVRLNSSLKYRLFNGFNVSAIYQHQYLSTRDRTHFSKDSYFARELVNRFSRLEGGTLVRPVPLGGVLDISRQASLSRLFRSQVDYSSTFSQQHKLIALAGFEVRSTRTDGVASRYYGYDERHAQNGMVDYVEQTLPLFYDNAIKGAIPFMDRTSLFNDRYLSYYANAAYTLAGKLTASASARLDRSNLFGVKTNQNGVPLWSGGLSWNVSKESFYKWNWLPNLKLRATFGYNGSVNKSVSAFTTASFSGYLYNLPYATIINPPNPDLRWERIRIANLGLDFSSRNDRISGSLEFFRKQGMDLIGDASVPPSSGISLFRGNIANTSGHGIDVSLRTANTIGRLKWSSNLVYSYIREQVTSYSTVATVARQIQSGMYLPKVGRPLYGIYSYRWEGLDAVNGDPIGRLNGTPSRDYPGILNQTSEEEMVYHGSARPISQGAVFNDLRYGDFTLSVNMVFRLGHYFRKNSITYGSNYGLSSAHGDYGLRWQVPGDEDRTFVPSLPLQPNGSRDLLYKYASVLVDRADNIRLEDIRLGYMLNSGKASRLRFGSLQVYLYAQNLGILWKATRFDTDPENQGASYPVRISAGVKMNFK